MKGDDDKITKLEAGKLWLEMALRFCSLSTSNPQNELNDEQSHEIKEQMESAVNALNQIIQRQIC